MNKAYNYVTIDNPNVPVPKPGSNTDRQYGEFSATNGNTCDFEVGPVKSYDMHLPHFSLREFQGRYAHDAIMMNQEGAGLDLLGVCMILQGEVRSFVKHTEEVGPSFNYSQNFKYDPDNEFKHLLRAGKPFHIAHFSVKTDYFKSLLPSHETWAESLNNHLDRKKRISGKRFMPIMPAQDRAMKNIFDCPMDGKLGYMIMETSLAQIILLQMYGMFQTENKSLPKTSASDKDLIHAVREYISENFLDDHSLTSLARHFATNSNKLMCLFRNTFGQTIFDYITEKRMHYAREILMETDLTVYEAARKLGYKNANHFSTAFKKNFGVCPSEMRTPAR
jgi:AraC-like DNA-binding protein